MPCACRGARLWGRVEAAWAADLNIAPASSSFQMSHGGVCCSGRLQLTSWERCSILWSAMQSDGMLGKTAHLVHVLSCAPAGQRKQEAVESNFVNSLSPEGFGKPLKQKAHMRCNGSLS